MARIFKASRDAATAITDRDADEAIHLSGLGSDESPSLAMLSHVIRYFGDQVLRRVVEPCVRVVVVVAAWRKDLGKGRAYPNWVVDFFQRNKSTLRITSDSACLGTLGRYTTLNGEVHSSLVARNTAFLEAGELRGKFLPVSVGYYGGQSDQSCRTHLSQIRKIDFQRR
jgi:hypothetical protein